MVRSEYDARVRSIRGNLVRDPIIDDPKLPPKVLFVCHPSRAAELCRWLVRPRQGAPFARCEAATLPMSKGQAVFVLMPRGWQVAGVCLEQSGRQSVVSFAEVPIE